MKLPKTRLNFRHALSALAASLTLLSPHRTSAATPPPLVAEAPILIPEAHGKFDFIEVDSQASRLLAAHPGNATLDVFDLNSGKLIKHVTAGVAQDAAIDEKGGKYYVSISAGKSLAAVDRSSLEKVGETPLPGPADIVAFDPKNDHAYVGHDDAAEVWEVDVAASRIVGKIAIPEGPEGILYDPANDRIYINSKSGNVVVVVDPANGKVVANWAVAPAAKPHGSALDLEGRRLFVAGGNGKLVALDLSSGKVLGSADVAQKVDQIAFDAGTQRVFCASGTGVISVVDAAGGNLKSLGNVASHAGAHSVAVDPKTHAVWTAFADGEKSYLLRMK
jgi:DNA-binding beta-propeller fold protein YncE